MSEPGSGNPPLRVAVIGSGPAGFYSAQPLLSTQDFDVRVDMFDQLPTPFGLVRHGVAPDHQKIKSVVAVYHKLAGNPRFRFFGNARYGEHFSLSDLKAHYHQIVFCTGAQSDRRLGIPGEDLQGSHAATEFVAWYNGHPDYADRRFDLSHSRAVVIGVGNVAVDVARILCRSVQELARTDIADHALQALEQSRVRETDLLGRRGPLQAAFTNPEIKELGALAGTETRVRAEEFELDPLSRRALEASADKGLLRRMEILRRYSVPAENQARRRLTLRFLVSPVEILGDERGRVRAVRLVRNEIHAAEDGNLRARPTESFETIDAGLVFRSVGYRGVRLPDLPFDERRGVIPNDTGRILPGAGSPALTGLYASGWIKRGPTGVIGTNKADAKETVDSMLEDAARGETLQPERHEPRYVAGLLESRGVRYISYADWLRLDAMEVERGKLQGRPRVKFTRPQEFLRALAR